MATASKPRTINVHLEEETHRLLRTLAASSGLTYAKVIAMGLRLLERQTPTASAPGSEGRGVQGEPATASGLVGHETASEPADPPVAAASDTEPAPPRPDDEWMAELNELFDQV